MSEIEIRTLQPDDWQMYRSVRLRALKDSPHAFGSTYAESVKYRDKQWQARLQDASQELDLPMVATLDNEPVGLAWIDIEHADDNRAHLYQMWVAPEVRGRGIARRMLEKGLAWARSRQVREMQLEVTIGNEPAELLYRSMGFEPEGVPLPVREGSDLREQTMVLDLALL